MKGVDSVVAFFESEPSSVISRTVDVGKKKNCEDLACFGGFCIFARFGNDHVGYL